MGGFEGARVLVTGSSRGIGRAVAEAFLHEGAHVVLNGRDPEGLDRARAGIVERQSDAAERLSVATFDVGDEAAVTATVAGLGRIDVLVNNAGFQHREPIIDADVATWRRIVEVDLVGAFLVARAVVPGMIAAGSGSIVNIGSVVGTLSRPATSAYAAAKSGLTGLTRAMCSEWAPAGIRVNTIAPGYVLTEINEHYLADPERSAWIEARTPTHRWGTVDDVVGPVLWLASGGARFVNGQTIHVDGGLTAVM